MKQTAAIFVIVVGLIAQVAAGSEAESFDYKNDRRGPKHWGDLQKDWKACADGKHQSPIDLVSQNVKIFSRLGRLQRNYHAANATLINPGPYLMVSWPSGAGTIRVNGSNFTLFQCHWHSPSEHAINGRRYPLEIHMVHKSSNNKTAVIAILYEYGRHDTFLGELTDEIVAIAGMKAAEEKEALGIVDPMHIKFGSRKYYRYIGSLTTPPCTEGVIWTIVKKVRTVSREQVRDLIKAANDGFEKNARPLQKENGRVIGLYNPRHTP
eukprot:PITA_31359